MNEDLNNVVEEETGSGEYERTGEVIETVEFDLVAPKEGTVITCKDPSGLDQSPIPEISSNSDKYSIDVTERPEIYWRKYSTLEYYSDEKIKAGETYTVFGKVKAAPGYIFNDPVELLINGEEVSSQEIEDYSLEGDSFTFYFDIEAVK
jgi:hypothetical protein